MKPDDKVELIQMQDATCPRGHMLRVVWVASKGRFGFYCETCDQVSPMAICGECWIEIQVRKIIQ